MCPGPPLFVETAFCSKSAAMHSDRKDLNRERTSFACIERILAASQALVRLQNNHRGWTKQEKDIFQLSRMLPVLKKW